MFCLQKNWLQPHNLMIFLPFATCTVIFRKGHSMTLIFICLTKTPQKQNSNGRDLWVYSFQSWFASKLQFYNDHETRENGLLSLYYHYKNTTVDKLGYYTATRHVSNICIRIFTAQIIQTRCSTYLDLKYVVLLLKCYTIN